MHFLHLNVNSLLPKIDEVKLIASKSNATVLGISETKLDKSIMVSALLIDGYDLIRSDRNRHGGDLHATSRRRDNTMLGEIFPQNLKIYL